MAAEPYWFEPNMLQTRNESIGVIIEGDNRLEKIDYADVVKDAKSIEVFLLRVGRNDVT